MSPRATNRVSGGAAAASLRRSRFGLALCLLLAARAVCAQGGDAREPPWPRTMTAPDATLTLYQPQPDSWNGYTLRARLAARAETGGKTSRVYYGVIEIEAGTLTDKGRRAVMVDKAKVIDAEFPAATPAQRQAWGQAAAQELSSKSRNLALDRLEAALAANDAVAADNRASLRNTPPRILFSSVPAVLVYIDGAPDYRALEGTSFQRVLNTRPLLLRDNRAVHYLKVFDGWLSAPAITGPWRVVEQPGAELRDAFDKAQRARLIDPLRGQPVPGETAPRLAQQVPAIVVATVPTELIVTEGAPNYAPIAGTQLLYVTNTRGHVFRDGADNKMYVLAAGRWFRAADENGPWEFVGADRLSPEFARIPDTSPKENVKASVAGTAQAREAAIAANIAQTAQIKIAGTTMTPPQFDGEPVLRRIEGTDLDYVANTATPLIRVAPQRFFALENGVWFSANTARGPWSVATEVPASIYSIPPSSALYYVTFAHVYAAGADSVQVGYTPGYLGMLVDPVSHVVVHGTGYVYPPWIGSVWYGAPSTYGFGAATTFTPWTGWAPGFGFGWAWGSDTAATGWGWGVYPWWGPWGWGWSYGPSSYPWHPAWGCARGVAWSAGGWAGYSGNLYQNWAGRARVWTANAWARRIGLSYNSRTGTAAAGQRGGVQNVYSGNFAAAGGAAAWRGLANNPDGDQARRFGEAHASRAGARDGEDLYAGRDGNIYRRTDAGWQQYGNGDWRPLGAEQAQLPESQRGASQPDGRALFARPPLSDEQLQQAHGGPKPPGQGELQQLDLENAARNFGGERAQNLFDSTVRMQRAFGTSQNSDARRH